MVSADSLKALLPSDAAKWIEQNESALAEVRLRAGRGVQLVFCNGGDALTSQTLESQPLGRILAALMEYSVYARQQELDEGYFTLSDGCRVGVCGRMFLEGSRLRMGEIGSACIRFARQRKGCADGIMAIVAPAGRLPDSTLLLSPPGLGKTTLLRDIARQLSDGGRRVGLADERHEIAACNQGVPTLDVGARTDVMDGCPRAEAIRRMLRTMSPQVVIADEIGNGADAQVLADAARCGVTVIASAHARSLQDALSRPCLKVVLESGAFQNALILGPGPGELLESWRRVSEKGGSTWKRA